MWWLVVVVLTGMLVFAGGFLIGLALCANMFLHSRESKIFQKDHI